MEPKTGKRIVSKGAYVTAQGKRAVLILLAGGVFTVGIYTYWSVSPSFLKHTHPNDRVLATSVSFFTLCFCCSVSKALYKKGRRVETGVPLTRANTADLPAPDSLVRASAEPLQAQKAVLLRAAAEGEETPPEQLVRASTGEK